MRVASTLIHRGDTQIEILSQGEVGDDVKRDAAQVLGQVERPAYTDMLPDLGDESLTRV